MTELSITNIDKQRTRFRLIEKTRSRSVLIMLSPFIPSLNQGPHTPTSSSSHRPHTSSPLTESFSPSPSASKLQSRRVAQYKSIATPTRRVSTAYSSRPSRESVDKLSFGLRLFPSTTTSGESENPRDALLRVRLRDRCARRAQQARTKRVEMGRRKNALSSDGDDLDMDSDEDNDEDTALNDEVCHGTLCFIQYGSSDANPQVIS